MPDNFGRSTSSEVSQALKDFCFPKVRRQPLRPDLEFDLENTSIEELEAASELLDSLKQKQSP